MFEPAILHSSFPSYDVTKILQTCPGTLDMPGQPHIIIIIIISTCKRLS